MRVGKMLLNAHFFESEWSILHTAPNTTCEYVWTIVAGVLIFRKWNSTFHENTIWLILYSLSHSLSPSCFNSLSFFSSSNFPFLIKFFFEFFLQNNICWIEIRKFFMNFPHTHTFCARIFQRMWVCKCEYVRLCVWKRIEHTKYSVIHISLITTTH